MPSKTRPTSPIGSRYLASLLRMARLTAHEIEMRAREVLDRYRVEKWVAPVSLLGQERI